MAFVTSAAPLTTSRSATLRCSSRPVAVSSFRGARVAAPAPKVRSAVRMEFEISEGVSYSINPAIVALAAAGWIIPSSIPAGIPLTNGAGLSQAFFASISTNLANFPAGPASGDPFWTLCFMWHIGMFACMTFGSIGFGLQESK